MTADDPAVPLCVEHERNLAAQIRRLVTATGLAAGVR